MITSRSYRNCLIRSESFQLAQRDSWIPRYALTRQDLDSVQNAAPSYHDRLDMVFWTVDEADEFALQDAMRWIDKNWNLERKSGAA